MENQSAIDYCFMVNLYKKNMQLIQDLYNEQGVAGFKVISNR